ncbi:MAG TPA: mycofactocin-associated electron transfer flavoprotein alpha subunit [Acidimicrobiales bacterium]
MAECGGRAILAGAGAAEAAKELTGISTAVGVWETNGFHPAAWAEALAPLVAGEAAVVLPASPDGRDLAPRLARALHRPLLAGAIEVRGDGAAVVRWGGLAVEDITPGRPFVATLQPGVRGVDRTGASGPDIEDLSVTAPAVAPADAASLEVLPPDAATMDLAEAVRIVGGGAGLDSAERFAELAELAAALDASLGATRVVTDRGWVGHERQIGTTGVVVDPRVYLAFGISGAVQHTSGLGQPDHIISINTDAHCPMMQLADLAIVSDANAVLSELLARLAVHRETYVA